MCVCVKGWCGSPANSYVTECLFASPQSVNQSGYFGPWLTESMFLRATRKQRSLLGHLCNTLSLFLHT